jgi:flagellar hook assembly protein FlgD
MRHGFWHSYTTFAFFPPSPNPTRDRTRLEFVLPERTRVQLRIYDVRGRLVSSVVNVTLDAGEHCVTWDGMDREGRRVAAGIYFAHLETRDASAVRKFVRLAPMRRLYN